MDRVILGVIGGTFDPLPTHRLDPWSVDYSVRARLRERSVEQGRRISLW